MKTIEASHSYSADYPDQREWAISHALADAIGFIKEERLYTVSEVVDKENSLITLKVQIQVSEPKPIQTIYTKCHDMDDYEKVRGILLSRGLQECFSTVKLNPHGVNVIKSEAFFFTRVTLMEYIKNKNTDDE